MPSDGSVPPVPTRWDALKYGGAVVGGGLLSGCTSTAETDDGHADGGSTDDTYSVTMSPVRAVEFDAVPETVFTVFSQYADAAVALGHGDTVTSVYVPEMSGTTMNHYYEHLAGVSFDWEVLHDPLSDGLSKEQLFDRQRVAGIVSGDS